MAPCRMAPHSWGSLLQVCVWMPVVVLVVVWCLVSRTGR
jgi:hypothetical protein